MGSFKKVIVVLLLIFIIVLIGAGFLFFNTYGSPNKVNANTTKLGPIYETEEYTVNLLQSSNSYIKAQFALELTDKSVLEELKEKKPLLQDCIIMTLSSRPLQELSTPDGKERLKKSLVDAINSFLDRGEVTKVYFRTLIFN